MSFNSNSRRSYSSSSTRYSAPRRTNKSSGNRKKYIDPALFVKAATQQEAASYVPQHTFSDFNLTPLLQANLRTIGYKQPSPIQDESIPAALEGKDIIGVASTGTGKTAAFALPILNKLLVERGSKAIIIAPTRELAEQIEQECKTLGKGSGVHGALLIGGTNMSNQLRALRQQPNLVIGTPGRIKDHMQRGSLQLANFNIIALDEVDRMLDMGFVKDVTEILKSTHTNRQSFFFSATIDQGVQSLITTFAANPHTVSLKASSSRDNVHQDVITYGGQHEKMEKLHDLLNSQDVTKAIVFDETQRSVERLENELRERGFPSISIHGGKSQGQRKRALASFKNSDATILVATDVAARGIDVVDISHVINYSTPNDYEDYVHRIGRAGRAGRVGYALTFIPR